MMDVQLNEALILPQVICAIGASCGTFVCGTMTGWSGSVLTKLDQDFKMAATEHSLVASLMSYGALFGSILSGKAMDFLGRRKLMLAFAPVAGCGWAITGIATNIYLIYLGRFICGFSTGFLMTSCTVYISETCQPRLRGRLGLLSMMSFSLGILTSYILGGLLSWRNSALACIVPALISFVCIYFVPESPYWYLMQGNLQASSHSLIDLRGKNFNVGAELNEMSLKLSNVGANLSYSELWNRRTLLPLTVALFMQTLQQFSSGSVITIYTSNIFEDAQSSVNIQMATIYTGIAECIANVVSIFLIDKYGRKIIFAFSVAFCGVFTGLLSGYFFALSSVYPWPTWASLVIILCILFSYCIGCSSIPFIIGSEIFNTSIRSRANSLVFFYNRVTNLIVIQVYPFAADAFGTASVFLFYAVVSIAGVVGTLLFVPETKGKSLEEIQEFFEGKAAERKKRKEPKRQKYDGQQSQDVILGIDEL